MIIAAMWLGFWDYLMESWFKTYSSLGSYPDDRKVKRDPK